VKNPHKPNPQRVTNRPRRPLLKKEGGGRKTIEKRQKQKKQREGRSNREGEERRHRN
jgi:hypothetical protein